MGMSAGGGRGGPTSEINMTPMIDVLLVLLIIFMVVQQSLQKGVSVNVPPVKKEQLENAQDVDQIVLDIQPGPAYFINSQPVQAAALEATIRQIFAPRPRKILFVKGAENITYGSIIHAVDASRAAGIEVVGLVPRSTQQTVAPAT